MGRLTRFLAAVALCLASAWAQTPASRPSLEALLAQAAATNPAEYGGISPDQDELADQIQSYGAEAVPGVLRLLQSPNEAVREFGGYVVRGLGAITEDHLDALIAAARSGNGWVAGRIARIGTPKAIAFLVEEIKRDPKTQTQVTAGLARAGRNAIPAMVEILKEKQAISPALTAVLREVFSEIKPVDETMVAQLTTVMKDNRLVLANRVAAIRILGAIGSPAASALADLKQLAAADPGQFLDVVTDAAVDIGTTEAVSLVASRLRTNPDILLLRDIAAWGREGREAGPLLVPLLKHQDWEIRIGAARTLGFIQYEAGAAELESALSNPSDWRVVYCAAESLGRLGLTSSIAELDRIARTHWFPAVRSAAEKAIQVIEKKESYVSRWHPRNFPFQYFEYQNAGRSETPRGNQPSRQQQAFVPGPGTLSATELKSMTYEIEGFVEEGGEVTKPKHTPQAGLRIGTGYLLAGNRGEWGGELNYRDTEGGTQKLIDENVEGIHETAFGIIATAGLAHMTMNSGYLYRIELRETGAPVASRWKALPGAPIKSGLLANGDLFVTCYGGDVLISSAGEIRMANEADRPR